MSILKQNKKESNIKNEHTYENYGRKHTKKQKKHNNTTIIYTRKAITLGTLIMILLVFVVAGIVAYLTDTDSKSNVFTMGNVSIELLETNFDSSVTLENVEAGNIINKNPQVRNTGDNPAYVYLMVTIPKGSYTNRGTTVTGEPLFTYTSSSDWTEMTGYTMETEDSITKVYYYNTILQPTEGSNITTALFDSVTVADFPNFDSLDSLNQNINISALAIQSTLPAVAQGENEFIKAYNLFAKQSTTIGQKVNYSVTVKNGEQVEPGTEGAVTLDDWEILDTKDGMVAMIYGDYLPTSAISSEVINAGSLTTDGQYRVWSTDDMQALKTAMANQSAWEYLITANLSAAGAEASKEVKATGGADMQLFMDSWSKVYSLNETIGNEDSYADYDLSSFGGYTDIDEADNLYFPHKTAVSDGNANCNGYWLVSQSADVTDGLMSVTCAGELKGVTYNSNDKGFRPVIIFPTSLLKQNPDGISWDIKSTDYYVVSFDANNGTGTMRGQAMPFNTAVNLRSNSFTRAGYAFTGWNTMADGSGVSYSDKASVTNLTNESGATVTLYAQWEEVTNVKYAVQIYGINQDVDENDEVLGLTFGPAVGANYNNSYVTHEYDANGSGTYDVMIVTHNVAEDGSETIASRVALTNSEGETVTRTEAQKQNYDINLHEMSWAEIEAVGDKSKFLDCMLCGDTKSVNLVLNSTIRSGSTQTAYGDGAGVLYSTVNDYYRRWNPAKSYSTSSMNNSAVGTGVTLDSNEQYSGSNARNAGAYKTSHIRATLIGSDVSNPTIGYAGDVNLDSTTCLYSCIESGLKDVITPKKVKYVTGRSSSDYDANNTPLVDSIWLLSNREVYGTGEYSGNTTEGLGTNGDGYSKFGNTESKYYMSTYNTSSTANRTAYNEASHTGWWLRSPVLSTTYRTYSVTNGGGINIYRALCDAYGLNFGFCIR